MTRALDASRSTSSSLPCVSVADPPAVTIKSKSLSEIRSCRAPRARLRVDDLVDLG
jgi:hypothetical protein